MLIYNLRVSPLRKIVRNTYNTCSSVHILDKLLESHVDGRSIRPKCLPPTSPRRNYFGKSSSSSGAPFFRIPCVNGSVVLALSRICLQRFYCGFGCLHCLDSVDASHFCCMAEYVYVTPLHLRIFEMIIFLRHTVVVVYSQVVMVRDLAVISVLRFSVIGPDFFWGFSVGMSFQWVINIVLLGLGSAEPVRDEVDWFEQSARRLSLFVVLLDGDWELKLLVRHDHHRNALVELFGDGGRKVLAFMWPLWNKVSDWIGSNVMRGNLCFCNRTLGVNTINRCHFLGSLLGGGLNSHPWFPLRLFGVLEVDIFAYSVSNLTSGDFSSTVNPQCSGTRRPQRTSLIYRIVRKESLNFSVNLHLRHPQLPR